MKCLLISPLRGLDPLTGDITYTEQLLAQPPAGVQYTDYRTAEQEQTLRPAYRLRPYLRDARAGQGPPARAWLGALGAKGLSLARRRLAGRLLLHEDWRFLRIAGAFDLAHIHMFPVGLTKPHPPVVLSDSIGNYNYLRDWHRWPAARIRRIYRVEGWLLRRFQVYHTTLHMHDAAHLVLMSEGGKADYVRRGVPAAQIAVIPPGIPDRRRPYTAHGPAIHIGFVAYTPRAKGGDVLLAAFAELHRRVPAARLFIAGGDPRRVGLPLPAGAVYLGPLAHAALRETLLPDLDIFALPSPLRGYSLVLVDALAQGLPLLTTTRIRSSPGILEEGVNGFAVPPGDPAALLQALLALCADAGRRERMRAASYRLFLARFHVDATNAQLRAVYAAAVGRNVKF